MTPPHTPKTSSKSPSSSTSSSQENLVQEMRLIQECRDGKLDSFEPLVKQQQERVFNVAYQVLRNESLAEEATQTTFVRTWQTFSKFRGQCSFGTWVYRICINECCNIIRSRNRKKELMLSTSEEDRGLDLDQLIHSQQRPDRETIQRELQDLITQALEKLPEEHRVVLVLRELHGMDYSEIARATNCRQGTVMSRLFHARRKLRKLLEKIV
jgi:RNA polymerase sigma-70 factor, ECF subfamily